MSPVSTVDKEFESPVIVDLGSRKRSNVKKLCQGEGPLVDELRGCLEELRASGSISPGAQPIVLVVRERAKRRSMLWPVL